MRSFTYEKWFDGSEFAFRIDGKLQWASPSVAVGFSWDEDLPIKFTLHKHGRLEQVHEWHQKTVKTYSNCGLRDLVMKLFVVESDQWDVAELNRMLTTTGYAPAPIREMFDTRNDEAIV